MTQQTEHPLVVRYLDDLHRLLEGIDPVERAEVVDGVREHLDASLTPGVGDDDVRRALAELGSPETVADEAYAGRPRQVDRPTRASGGWIPTVAAVFQALAAFVLLSVVGVSSAEVITSSSGPVVEVGSGKVVEPAQTSSLYVSSLGKTLLASAAVIPFWLVVVVLVVLCGLWTRREKVALISFVPVGVLLFGLLPELGHHWFGVGGVYAGALTCLGVTVLGGGVLVGVLTRRALRRAS